MSKFRKGDPRPPGAGRKPGSPNKLPGELRAMVLEALAAVGGVDYLVAQAKRRPQAFLALLARVVPREVSGPGGAPMTITSIPTPRVLLVELPDNHRCLIPPPPIDSTLLDP